MRPTTTRRSATDAIIGAIVIRMDGKRVRRGGGGISDQIVDILSTNYDLGGVRDAVSCHDATKGALFYPTKDSSNAITLSPQSLYV